MRRWGKIAARTAAASRTRTMCLHTMLKKLQEHDNMLSWPSNSIGSTATTGQPRGSAFILQRKHRLRGFNVATCTSNASALSGHSFQTPQSEAQRVGLKHSFKA